jgi:biofilm PGA synthesis N-glycosyltransferase PgaC
MEICVYLAEIIPNESDGSLAWTSFYLYFFILMATLYSTIVLLATPYIISRYREQSVDDIYNITRSDSLPGLTFIVPAYNECQSIAWTVRTLLNLSYRYKQIIVVNDGSTDNSLDILIKEFSLIKIPPSFSHKLSSQPIRGYYQSKDYPELRVVDKVNGGKADALNSALNICQTPAFATTDADTLVEDSSLNYLIRPFLERPETLVVHSSIGIVNGCKLADNRIIKRAFPKNMFAAFQVIEYIRTFYCDRMCWEWSKGSLIVAGVFGIYKTEAVVEVGGYSTKSVVEDMELIMRLHKYMLEAKRDYHIRFIPDVVAWTEVPSNLEALTKQRLRWYTGTTQCLIDYRKLCFNPKYKSIGMFVVPYYIIDKVVPIIELSGYLIVLIFGFILGWLDVKMFLLLGFVCWAYTTFLTFSCILVEELTFRKYPDFSGTLRMLAYAFFENMSYRFIILDLKLRGLIVTKKKGKHWLVTPKKGFNSIEG